MSRFLLLGITLIAPARPQSASEQALNELLEQMWQEHLREHPTSATALLGRSPYDDRWPDDSLEAIARRKKSRLEHIRRLERLDAATLSRPARLDYELALYWLRLEAAEDRYPGELLAIDPVARSAVRTIPATIRSMPAASIKDYENIVARLRAAPRWIDQQIALLEEGLRRGVTQPAIVLRDLPSQVDGLLAAEPGAHPLLEKFREFPASIPPAERKRLLSEAAAALDGGLLPALRKLKQFLTTRYLPGARQTIAHGSLPEGEQWYAVLVRSFTTTQLSPEQIHQIGLDEVRRIRGEMQAVLTQAQFSGDLAAFQTFLRTDPRFYFSSASELLMAYRDLCKRIDPELPRLFGKLPRTPYGVREVESHIAPSETSARYQPGSVDGSRPGYFLVNTYALPMRPKYEMEALAMHESVPGHHLQIALANELENVPPIRKTFSFTAFIEGWGLYAESLGEELGFYRDPYSKFGRLSFDMWRACRLVVDTGMHLKGWSRQQAIDYMKQNTALAEHNIIAEVDRYIAWPGQALAYKIGELKFKELRRQAERQLGDRFDVRRFHDALLANGPVPMEMLDGLVRLAP